MNRAPGKRILHAVKFSIYLCLRTGIIKIHSTLWMLKMWCAEADFFLGFMQHVAAISARQYTFLDNTKLPTGLIVIIARSYISRSGISTDRPVYTSRSSGARADKSRALIIYVHARQTRQELFASRLCEWGKTRSSRIIRSSEDLKEKRSNRRGNSLYTRKRLFRFAAR